MKTTPLLLAFCFLVGGCVSKGKYDQAVATTQITRAELDQTSSSLKSLKSTQAELDRTKAEIDRLQELDRTRGTEHLARLDQLKKRLAELEAAQHASEARAALYRPLTMKLKKQIDNGDPVASNVTPEGRRKNRRTEITLQPNIDELVKVPE